MSNIQIFENTEFGKVRTVVIEDKQWFVGKDVAEILGYTNASKAISDHIRDKHKLNNESLSSLGQRGGWLIDEAGLYSLVLRSKMSKAEAFHEWVTAEVLPSIRKTGSYNLPDFTDPAEAAIAWAKEYKEKQKALAVIEQQKPLVEFANHISCSSNSIPVGDFAKVIHKNGIDMGRNDLFKWFRKNSILMHDNIPYQRYIDNGWFTVKEGVYYTPYGTRSYTKTLVTGKGQIAITERLRKELA